MSAGNESRLVIESVNFQGTPDVLTATGDHTGWRVPYPCTLLGVAADITTATVSSGGIVVAIDKRITKGSDTGRIAGDAAGGGGVITIPTSMATGKVIYKPITPVDLNPGEELVPEVTTAAAGGGAAGGCHYHFHIVPRSERMQNYVTGGNVVLSA